MPAPPSPAAVEMGRVAVPGGGGYASRLEGQVKAYGDIVGQDFKKSVGSLLGDLNGIGALRSGAVQSGVNDLTTNYGRQIGNYAAQTATDAARLDQQEAEFGRGLASQNRQFDASLGFDRERAASDDRFRGAELGQRGSQFDRSLASQDRQFDAGMFQRDKEYTGDSAFRFNEAERGERDRAYDRSFNDRKFSAEQNAAKKKGIGQLLGGALGIASNFIPGGTVVGKVINGVLK
jgi:hypothetical protein